MVANPVTIEVGNNSLISQNVIRSLLLSLNLVCLPTTRLIAFLRALSTIDPSFLLLATMQMQIMRVINYKWGLALCCLSDIQASVRIEKRGGKGG